MLPYCQENAYTYGHFAFTSVDLDIGGFRNFHVQGRLKFLPYVTYLYP